MSNLVYTVSMRGQSVSAAATLVSVFGTAAAAFELLDLWVTNEDVETSQQIAVQLVELTADDGTNTPETPVPLNEGDPASLVTGNSLYTVEPTAGSTLYRWGFNQLNGLWVPFPDRQLPRGGVGTTQGLALELLSTPGAATVFSAGMTIREIRL
jgi:hypothetical protein